MPLKLNSSNHSNRPIRINRRHSRRTFNATRIEQHWENGEWVQFRIPRPPTAGHGHQTNRYYTHYDKFTKH